MSDAVFPDVEEALLYWLHPQLEQMAEDVGIEYATGVPGEAYPYEFGSSSAHVGTVTPSNLQVRMPFVRVGIVTGADDKVTDFSRVDVEVFAARRNHARLIAEIIRQRLIGRYLRIDTPGGLIILDGVSTEVKPYALPWDDPDVDRYFGVYQVAARR